VSSVATKKSVDLFGRHFQWKLGFSGKSKLDDFLQFGLAAFADELEHVELRDDGA